MSKKRKTRKEKIILQLKRKIGQQKNPPASALEPKLNLSQEAISKQLQTQPVKDKQEKRVDISVFSDNLKLNKKDLLKTLVLALLIISFEVMLYLKLR
jgi:hypothetical protein